MTDSPGRHPDTPRTPPDAAPLSLADAAVRLGISPDAARKRLERGTLRGEKRNGRWLVSLDSDAAASTRQDATPADNRTLDAGAVAELRALLGEERQRADRYLEAATIWQGRARHLEERLTLLEAGERSPDDPSVPSQDPARASETAQDAPAPAAMGREPVPGFLDRIRAVFRRTAD